MERIWKNLAFLGVVVLLAGTSPASAQKSTVEHLRTEWEAERKEFTDIAAAMRDHFSYRATPEVRTFGEIVVHVIDDNTGFLDAASGAAPGPENRFSNLKTPAEILKALNEHFDHGTKILAGMTEQQAMESVPRGRNQVPRWLLIMQAIGHAKEHYGNLVTYTRLNGVVPPTTAASQQRQQQPPNQ
jgi:uncharacterized damage-inducible protein DinB